MDAVPLTVAGDTGTIEIEANPAEPLVGLVADWATRCSSHPPADLVVLSGDQRTILDPGAPLGSLGLGPGATVRLVTGDEAMSLLDGTATIARPDRAPAMARPVVSPGPLPPPPVQPPPTPPERPRPEGITVRHHDVRPVPGAPTSLGVPAPASTRPSPPLDRLAPPAGAPYADMPPPPSRSGPLRPIGAPPGLAPDGPAGTPDASPAPAGAPGPTGQEGAGPPAGTVDPRQDATTATPSAPPGAAPAAPTPPAAPATPPAATNPPAGPPASVAGPIPSGPTQSGPMQSGPTQSGPMQSGPVQSGPMPSGPAPAGPAPAGPYDRGPATAPAPPAPSGPVPAGAGGPVWGFGDGTATPWPPVAPSDLPPTLRPPSLEAPVPGRADDEDAALPQRVPGRRRFTRALKAGLSRKSTPETQPGAFAKAAVPSAGERYRLALQETDRRHNLEMMIRSASLRRCVVIAVVSPKGGAGKTSLTALLGMLFAEMRRDPVLALDANPDFGNLRDKLASPGADVASTDDLSTWLADQPNATPAELSALLGVGPHGLRFLPTPTGSIERMVKAADFDLYQGLIARLRNYEGIILVDCGTGLLDPPVRAALGTADQIVLITDSSADTARLVVKAARYLPADTPTWLVANKMPDKGAMVDLNEVAGAIPQLRGVTVVPEQRLSENVVTPSFDWATAPDAWQEPVREVAARLANNWRMLP